MVLEVSPEWKRRRQNGPRCVKKRHARKGGEGRLEGRRTGGGAALRRTRPRAGARAWRRKVSVLGCTGEHWFDMQLLAGYNKRQQTAKVSGCNRSETPHKGCLLQRLLSQTGRRRLLLEVNSVKKQLFKSVYSHSPICILLSDPVKQGYSSIQGYFTYIPKQIKARKTFHSSAAASFSATQRYSSSHINGKQINFEPKPRYQETSVRKVWGSRHSFD